MTTTPDDNDPRYEAFMGAFGPNATPEGQEDPTEDLGPTPEDLGAPNPQAPRESNSEARWLGTRSGDMLREFLANGFTRQEAIMFIAQMLPHHPH
ncbi:hypothetical protein SEA_SCUTTLE_42 [Arthrobacter phage Scuttle]|uniref:Uncharacterized protein n=1 Tax=Arthrobacter phage Scuttle TaxID=2572523 RepID=A0A4D6T4T0_9CAUD|nr:hypothetical protein SEA_SCUTTLE_42 [Arthrobacter phage Scuttle]